MNFNPQQKEAIETVDGNVCVVASAGSGKTTVLTQRIKNMVENHNVLPSSILAVTFSRKAKENIESRLNDLKIYHTNIETFHSLALKIISNTYGINRFKVWTAQWEKEKVIKDIYTSLYHCKNDKSIPYNDIFSFISKQKSKMNTPSDNLVYPINSIISNRNLKEIYKRYEEYKHKKSLIEFDDFLNIANDALEHYEDIANKYKNMFQYILVDEYQDVSLSQAMLLNKLNTSNTMIVGDPLQAIYSFRGGDSKFILNFDRDYNNVKVINLNTNYRCSQNIVNTANMLAKTIPDSKHRNYIESIAFKSTYKTPEFREFNNSDAECKWISKKILQLKKENIDCNDIAILARTNAQLQKIETVLHKHRISFDVKDSVLFTELPEIKLILSYFKLAINVNDNESFEYLYNKPNRWLDKKFLEEVKQNSKLKNVSLYKSMSTIDRRYWRFKNGIDEIYEVIQYIQKSKSSIPELIKYLREKLKIDEFVTKGKQSDDGSFIEQIDNLNCFEDLSKQYSSIKDFIKYLNVLNEDVKKQNKDKVKLLTIHKAKGMEYPIVFIIGCNEKMLPHYKNNNVDDERRLFYVAITRAERELYITYSSNFNGDFVEVSPFIKDIEKTITSFTN